MKMILFASALALSTAAIAQDTTPAPTTPPAADQSAPAAAPATPDAAAPATPDAAAPAPAAAPAMPDQAAPAAAPAASATDDSNLPACSKSVTDKCVQKGGKASSHHAKKHAKK